MGNLQGDAFPREILSLLHLRFTSYEWAVAANPYNSGDRIYWQDTARIEVRDGPRRVPLDFYATVREHSISVRYCEVRLWHWWPDNPNHQRLLLASERGVKDLTPEQTEALLERLDRLCANTITREEESAFRFTTLLDWLRLSNDAQVQRLAKALHNKFDEVGLMTPAEYRHIKSNVYDRDRRCNPTTVSY